ncbi:MAG: winged helix-turn-helix domain-containing protein [Methanomicrobiales archaeon]|nr:winged helix-turn-helix domain-containing protein [Methanomicrobiales archaeon]
MLRRLLTSGTRVQLLTLFLLDPDREHYPREIERVTGGNINAVRRELHNLEELGLLASATRGNQRVYTVNREFPLFPELSGHLFLVGDLDPAGFPQLVQGLRERLGREIRILHLTPAGFRTRLGNGDPELRNLMEGPKLVIIPLS